MKKMILTVRLDDTTIKKLLAEGRIEIIENVKEDREVYLLSTKGLVLEVAPL